VNALFDSRHRSVTLSELPRRFIRICRSPLRIQSKRHWRMRLFEAMCRKIGTSISVRARCGAGTDGLAGNRMPIDGDSRVELFDENSGLAHEFVLRKSKQDARDGGELARSIRTLDGISSVRVLHLRAAGPRAVFT